MSLTGQFASLDDDLNGVENLLRIARLHGYSWADARGKAAEMLATFALTEAGQRQVKYCSGGMRRRLDIAASLLSAPDLLFLDEPTTRLDPSSRRTIWEIIRTLRAAGTMLLLTTQYYVALSICHSHCHRTWVGLGFRPEVGVSGVLIATGLLLFYVFSLLIIRDSGIAITTSLLKFCRSRP